MAARTSPLVSTAPRPPPMALPSVSDPLNGDVTRYSTPRTTLPGLAVGVIVTLIVPVLPGLTVTGVPVGAVPVKPGWYGSPAGDVTVVSSGCVSAVAVGVLVPDGAPASVNGPICWTKLPQNPRASWCSPPASVTRATEVRSPACAAFRSPNTSGSPSGPFSSTCARVLDVAATVSWLVAGGTS